MMPFPTTFAIIKLIIIIIIVIFTVFGSYKVKLDQEEFMRNHLYVLIFYSLFGTHLTAFGKTKPTEIEAVRTYSKIINQSYDELLSKLQHLDQKIKTLLEDPKEKNLEAAKSAWISAHKLYGQTEVYRFYDGPIDDQNGPEPFLNAWPIDENYIDYVRHSKKAGFLAEKNLKLTKENLLELNEKGSEANISTGFHAIEFMLWGQDLDPNGPGNRPVTDFQIKPKDHISHNRRTYLKLLSQIMIEQIQLVREQWREGQENYRKRFESNPQQGLKKVLTGMIFLLGDELASERMFVAYDSRSQEDEQSCFSDTTHLDLIANFLGVINVYRGQWKNKKIGPGIKDILAGKDVKLAEKIDSQLSHTLETLRNLPKPFERLMKKENDDKVGKAYLRAINEIESAADNLQRLSKQFGFQIDY